MSGLLSDVIGKMVMCGLSTAGSDGQTSSAFTGINIQGMGSVLFLCQVVTAMSTDGDGTDGTVYVQIQYSSASALGSDAATSNTGMSCTDAIVTFSSAHAAGTIYPLEVNVSAKGFPDGAGYLFPKVGGDSVSVLRILAIPFPANRTLPIAQTVTTVVADD